MLKKGEKMGEIPGYQPEELVGKIDIISDKDKDKDKDEVGFSDIKKRDYSEMSREEVKEKFDEVRDLMGRYADKKIHSNSEEIKHFFEENNLPISSELGGGKDSISNFEILHAFEMSLKNELRKRGEY